MTGISQSIEVFPGCFVAYSTRINGSMDTPEQALAWIRACVPDKKEKYLHLEHGTTVVLDENQAHELQGDAIISQHIDHALLFRVADCVPIALFHPQSHTFGLIHGGWRSLAGGIMEKTLNQFLRVSKANPQEISVWIGPSLRSCCNVVERNNPLSTLLEWKSFLRLEKNKKTSVDLQGFCSAQLMQAGVSYANIKDSGLCTYHNPGFYSYRRFRQEQDPSAHGRIAVGIWMNNT